MFLTGKQDKIIDEENNFCNVFSVKYCKTGFDWLI